MTLETEILMLEQKLENNLSEVEKCGIRTKLEIKKQSPEQWINYKTQGSIVRSRTSWYDKVEKNTKYFFEWKKGISIVKQRESMPRPFYLSSKARI